MVEAYEVDDTQKNPYRMTTRGKVELMTIAGRKPDDDIQD
jgi:hypothetical protein